MRQISVREMQNILKENGYEYVRQKGSHQVWKNEENTISIPVVQLKSVIANRILKENNFRIKS